MTDNPEMQQKLDELTRGEPFDIIQVESSQMAVFQIRSAIGGGARRAQHRVRAVLPHVPVGTIGRAPAVQLARVLQVQARGNSQLANGLRLRDVVAARSGDSSRALPRDAGDGCAQCG